MNFAICTERCASERECTNVNGKLGCASLNVPWNNKNKNVYSQTIVSRKQNIFCSFTENKNQKKNKMGNVWNTIIWIPINKGWKNPQ